MTPEEAERRLQQGYLDGQEVLKAYWRSHMSRTMKALAATAVKTGMAAMRSVGWRTRGRR